MLAVGRVVPGFGGLYLDDDGKLTILTISGDLSSETRQQLSATLAGIGFSDDVTKQASSARVVKADNSFADIALWRDSIAQADIPGFILLDADEKANKVSVTVEGQDGVAAVRQVALRARIPASALDIVIGKPVELAAAVPPPSGLAVNAHWNELGRKSYPGVLVSTVDDFGYIVHLCTATRFLRDVIDEEVQYNREFTLTAAHCTGPVWQFNLVNLWQPQYSAAPFALQTKLGATYISPGPIASPPTTCGANSCRWSDAALFKSTSPDIGEHFYLLNAAPPVGSAYPLSTGGKQMTTCCAPLPAVGEIVKKTGAASGSTTDIVRSTCVATAVAPGYRLVCQNLAGNASTPSYFPYGDSGAPVWREIGTQVLWHGLLSFYYIVDGRNVYGYSTSNYIMYELRVNDPVLSAGVY